MQLISKLLEFDDSVLGWINQFMGRWPWVDRLSVIFLDQNPVKLVPYILVIVILWFRDAPERESTRKNLVIGIFSALGAMAAGRLLATFLPFRDRPILRPELNFHADIDLGWRAWSAFPSDHAALAFALTVVFYRISPRVGIATAIWSTVAICLPRLYNGVHHPTDLIGGALIGAAIALALPASRSVQATATRLLSRETSMPAVFYAVGFLILFEISEMFGTARGLAHVLARGL